MRKWANRVEVDILRDWQKTVHECIEKRVWSLKQLHVNKRKKHVLRNKVHLDYLSYLHDHFMLVPADKASNNVIVVCRKYYFDIVIKEPNSTNTLL